MKREIKKEKKASVKIKERAVMLSKSINQVKQLGIEIEPNAPIEGKMFW